MIAIEKALFIAVANWSPLLYGLARQLADPRLKSSIIEVQ
jgi:hypothetical protein